MPLDFISAQIREFKNKASSGSQEARAFVRESPYERTRKEVQAQLARSEKYRSAILQNVTTFAGLSPEAIIAAAQSMEELFYVRGDIVIEQDDIGDAFFVLEEGRVSVSRKVNPTDPNENPRELAQLGRNSHFGEISLLTAEPRSATVTVISDQAKCLKMTKQRFETLLATTNKVLAENRRNIGRDVLDTVPLFKSLSAVNKKKLLEVMIPMTYLPSSYICRQGTTGNSFFILTEGSCKVTINNPDKTEREVAKLRCGDFFGEVALIESSNRRTANVISVDTVSCLSLSRNDFNRLLKNLKVKLMEHQALRSGSNNDGGGTGSGTTEIQHISMLAKKRRISGFNTHGQRDETRIGNLFRRFGKFTTESLWNSLYSRYYRTMLLDQTKAAEYGKVAQEIMENHSTRISAVRAIGQEANRIMEMDHHRRTPADHSFVFGLLRQRNALREGLCRSWPLHQYMLLCKKVKIIRVKAFRKITEVDSRGTTAFLVLRGALRIFSRANRSAKGHLKVFFEQDLFPGEIFGEAALGGMHTRLISAQAITDVELAVIDDQDFMLAQDRDSMLMGAEERCMLLSQISLFKQWDSYKLMRLAHALVQEEVNKGAMLITAGKPSKDLFVVVNGRVNILDHPEKKHVVTTLHRQDYLGESSVINKFVKSASSKVTEQFCAMAVTRVDVLILHELNFTLFDTNSVELAKEAFFAKNLWRHERVTVMKHERAKLRKHQRMMHRAGALLPVDMKTRTTGFIVTSPMRSSTPQLQTVESPPRTAAPKLFSSEAHHHMIMVEEAPESPVLKNVNGDDWFFKEEDELEEDGDVAPLKTQKSGHSRKPKYSLSDAEQMHGMMKKRASSFNLMRQGTGFTTMNDSTVNEGPKPSVHELNKMFGLEGSSTSQRGSTLEESRKLKDLEDIPDIFSKDFNQFMVSTALKFPRELERYQDVVKQGRKPKSARLRINSAMSRRDSGFVATQGRPKTADDATDAAIKTPLVVVNSKTHQPNILQTNTLTEVQPTVDNENQQDVELTTAQKQSAIFQEMMNAQRPATAPALLGQQGSNEQLLQFHGEDQWIHLAYETMQKNASQEKTVPGLKISGTKYSRIDTPIHLPSINSLTSMKITHTGLQAIDDTEGESNNDNGSGSFRPIGLSNATLQGRGVLRGTLRLNPSVGGNPKKRSGSGSLRVKSR